MESWDWIGWVVAAFASVFALKATVRFDLNEWLKDRREVQKTSLRALCTHIRVGKDNGAIVVRSTFISRSGTSPLRCDICGVSTDDEQFVKENTEYWARNPDKFRERMEKFDKLTKRLGRVH